MKPRPLYIETEIACDLDTLWAHTQDPEVHQEWDLRFTEIEYLPRTDPAECQKFLYSTRIGFGLRVDGHGESVATRVQAHGESTSVLKFWSDRPISIIKEGSGYWRYVPVANGIRFFTGYDYRTRWGLLGAALDRFAFRPLMIWATAWSFDRLKNWIERGIHPRQALSSQATVTLASLALGTIWIYQGLVPKLLFKEYGELALMERSGLFPGREAVVLDLLAIGEILFGIALAVLQSRVVHAVNVAALLVLGVGALFSDPRVFLQPFSPLALNLSMIALSVAALLNLPNVPRARNCKDPTSTMRSIYARALGPEFAKLHPKIQERFGFGSGDRIASIGRGVMEQVWRGRPYTLPFLYVGTWRNIMFPKQGRNVPFTIENYAYRDGHGRETVTWARKYRFPDRERRFDATMIFSEQRNRIVDYLGTHQHLAVDIDLAATENGGLRLRSGEQRFYEGPIAFRFPMVFSGSAEVCEWFDDDVGKFKISVQVTNRTWGKLFGYRGTFDVEYPPVRSPADIPADVRPVREERRE